MRTLLILLVLILSQTSFGQEKPLNEEINELETLLAKDPTDLKATIRLSDCYNLNSQYYKSLNLLHSYEGLVKSGHPRIRAEIYLSYGKTYKFKGENGLATLNFLEASDEFLKVKDYKGYLRCGIEQIEFSRRTRRFKEGAEQYYYYVHFAKKHHITDPKIWIGLYNRYAAVLNETKYKHRASIHFSFKALDLAKKINDENSQAVSYNELGFAYHNLGVQDSALIVYQKAETAYKNLRYLREYVHVRYNILMLKMQYNLITPQQQIDELWKLGRYVDSAKVDYYKTEIYHALRTLYYKTGDYKASCDADFIYERNLTKETQRIQNLKLEEVAARYKNKKLKKENADILGREKEKEGELASARTQFATVFLVLIGVILALAGLWFLLYKLRKVNKLLLKRNEQKTVLVQEIHHRVKNNLQFVRSILEMQKGSIESEEGVQNLMDVSRRVDAMSLVHEMLYIEEEGMGVSVKAYLERLMRLSQILFADEREMTVQMEIEDIEIPVDKMVSLGIICSELFTNSVKHAFSETDQPFFHVVLRSLGDKNFSLEVSDNGKENLHINDTKRFSLGMRLIDIFSRQLNGTYMIYQNNGYEYILRFRQ